MAPQSNANVNLSDTSHDQGVNAVDVMTLADAASANKLPVYFNSSPFLLDNDALRDIIDSVAVHRPQPLSIIIDERTQEQHPDLMLSIQTYCYHNDDLINLHSVDLCSAKNPHTEPSSLQQSAVVIGPQALLQAIQAANTDDKTIIYIPDNLDDQLNLHQLLQADQQQTIICLVNTGMYSDEDELRLRSGLVRAVNLAIAQDAHLFAWMENDASELIKRDSDALAYLIMQYCSVAESDSTPAVERESYAIEQIVKAAGEACTSTDAQAMLIAMKAHLSTTAGSLAEGQDIRVWQLLNALGCTLWFDSLQSHTVQSDTAQSDTGLLGLTQVAMLKELGVLEEPCELEEPSVLDAESPKTQNLSTSHITSAFKWLSDQH